MKRKTFFMGLLLALGILIAGVATAPGADDLLAPYEAGERAFRRAEIGDKIVYFHQRTIGEAIVEKDFIVYQFDSDTKALLDKKVHWRPEIPEDPAYAAPAITKELAEAMAEGEAVFSQLYIVSPESDVFPLDPTPENPCWVVRSAKDGRTIVTIINAVTGEFLGYGMQPPQQ